MYVGAQVLYMLNHLAGSNQRALGVLLKLTMGFVGYTRPQGSRYQIKLLIHEIATVDS